MFKLWKTENKLQDDYLANNKKITLYRNFTDWAVSRRFDVISLPTFNKLLDEYLSEKSLLNVNTRSLQIKNDIKGKRALSQENKELLNFVKHEFSESVEGKREDIATDLKLLSNGLKHNGKKIMLLHGSTGHGKTDVTLRTLKELEVPYRRFRGAIKTVSDFYKALYANNGCVLIFDDVVGVIKKNSIFMPLLLSACDDYEGANRRLSILDKKDKDFVSEKQLELSGMTLEDMEREVGEKKYPQSFVYTGVMLFLFNAPITKIEPALVSRSYVQHVDFSREDIIEDIEEKIGVYNVDYSMEEKAEVLIFIKEFKNHFTRFDFRVYRELLTLKALEPHLWKEKALKKFLKVDKD